MNVTESPKWLELPVDVRRQRVLDEIAANRAVNNGIVDLNNFYCLFFPSDHDSLSNARNLIIEHAGGMDIPIKSGHPENQTENNSQVFLQQTPRQLFTLLDRTVEEHHVDMEHKDALLAEFFSLTQTVVLEKLDLKKVQRKSDIVDELHEMFLPVYIELRILGYNDTDLGVD